MWDGYRIGNIEIGARHYDSFADSVSFRTSPAQGDRLPLSTDDDRVTAFELRRLAVPYPAMMTSLNQIGFDSYHWLVGVVQIDEPDADHRGAAVVWAVGAHYNEAGELVPLKGSEFMFPMAGRYRNDSYILEGKNIEFEVSGIRVPFKTFQLRGQMQSDLSVLPGATVYAEVSPFNDPVYGPLLAAGGLVNKNAKVVAAGTYLTKAYQQTGTANQRPDGIKVKAIDYEKPNLNRDGKVTVSFQQDGSYLASDHVTSVLLIDDANSEPVWIDYRGNTVERVDNTDALQGITLTIPAGTPIPHQPRAVVMTDVFPLYQQALTEANWWEQLLAKFLTWFYQLLP